MADPLHFDLVSPERLLVSAEVEVVMVPGSEGYFTVLAHHAPVMSTLKPGLVEVTTGSGETDKYFVRGGFADVTPEGLTLLAEEAIRLQDLNAEMLAQAVRDAEEDVTDAGEDADKRRSAQSKLDELREVQRWIIPA